MASTDMRTLILMRHAKSDYPPGVADRDRPLSARGERDAVAAGHWIGAAFPRVDEVVVSPARRARQTWQRIAGHIEVQALREDDRIYDDWGSRLPEVVAAISEEARTALVVGHNPGIEEYALALARGGDPLGLARLSAKFPTSGIAVLHLPGSWGRPGEAALAAFAVPRG